MRVLCTGADGYIGAVSALDDQTGVADYFALIAR